MITGTLTAVAGMAADAKITRLAPYVNGLGSGCQLGSLVILHVAFAMAGIV